MTLTFNAAASYSHDLYARNIKFKGQFVQKLQWKRTDGQTDGQTHRITFPANAVSKYALYTYVV